MVLSENDAGHTTRCFRRWNFRGDSLAARLCTQWNRNTLHSVHPKFPQWLPIAEIGEWFDCLFWAVSCPFCPNFFVKFWLCDTNLFCWAKGLLEITFSWNWALLEAGGTDPTLRESFFLEGRALPGCIPWWRNRLCTRDCSVPRSGPSSWTGVSSPNHHKVRAFYNGQT